MKVVNPLLERCFQLIELLAEEPRAFRLGVISERLGLQKGAVHRLLAALCSMGWVEQEPETGFYRLTLRLAIMGQRVLLATRIPDLTRPVLQKLAEESQELVRMAIVEGDGLTWVAFVQGRRTGLIYQPEMIGKVPLTVTANGKAWLSTLPPEEAMRIVRRGGLPAAGALWPARHSFDRRVCCGAQRDTGARMGDVVRGSRARYRSRCRADPSVRSEYTCGGNVQRRWTLDALWGGGDRATREPW